MTAAQQANRQAPRKVEPWAGPVHHHLARRLAAGPSARSPKRSAKSSPTRRDSPTPESDRPS